MDLQHPSEALTFHLDLANSCENDTWQLWDYVAHGEKVILCGYRDEFKVSGFLVFHGSKRIRLPVWLQDAVFSVEGDLRSDPAEPMVDYQNLHTVLATSMGLEYRIVCERVKFYPYRGSSADVE